MCGIIGITSKENVKENLIKCLSNLEYRGYDSVGVYLNKLIKTKGRVKDLVIPSYLDSKVGLGHSRWATHGEISDKNAHPFESDNFVLVHNVSSFWTHSALKFLHKKSAFKARNCKQSITYAF
jgi:glucosamine--fructose-6-phosphate aminotransferase (isomerizing)